MTIELLLKIWWIFPLIVQGKGLFSEKKIYAVIRDTTIQYVSMINSNIITQRKTMKKLYIAVCIVTAGITGCVSFGNAPSAGYNVIKSQAGDIVTISSHESPEGETQVYVPVSRYKW